MTKDLELHVVAYDQAAPEHTLELVHEELAATSEELQRQNAELLATRQELEEGLRALRASEERYRQLFDGTTEGFALHEIVCNADGQPVNYRFLEINAAFEQLTGLHRDDLLGKTVLEALPGTEPFWIETYGRVALTGEPIRFEHYSGVLDRHYEVSAYRPAPYKFACLFVDITARAKTAQILRDNERKLRALFEILPVGVSVLDSQRNIRYMNPALSRTLDLPAGEAGKGRHTGRSYRRPDGSPMSPDEFPSVRAVREQQVIRDVEIGVVKEDGSLVWTNVSASPLPYDDWSVIIVTADITELRRARDELETRVLERTIELQRANENLSSAEEELRRQNEELRSAQDKVKEERQRYQELFHLAPDGYLVTSRNGGILEANRAASDLLGVPADRLPGTQLGHYVLPADSPILGDVFDRFCARTEGPPLRAEMRFQRDEGEVIQAAVAATASRTPSGEIEGVRWLLRDVTREKQMHDTLVHAEKLSIAGQLAASFAHEINNPLAAAIGCLDLVYEEMAEGKDVGQSLGIIHRSLDRASRLVSQLQELHRRSELEEKQPADLNEIMAGVLLLTRKRARSAGVEISWEPVAGLQPLPVMVDGMQQVFLNLVLNALEAMPNGGHLDVCIRRVRKPARIGIQFADDGPGLDPTIRGQLFEPFRTSKAKGSGLGLFISQNIVQQHGGSIEVESSEGKGTTFTVWLPV